MGDVWSVGHAPQQCPLRKTGRRAVTEKWRDCAAPHLDYVRRPSNAYHYRLPGNRPALVRPYILTRDNVRVMACWHVKNEWRGMPARRPAAAATVIDWRSQPVPGAVSRRVNVTLFTDGQSPKAVRPVQVLPGPAVGSSSAKCGRLAPILTVTCPFRLIWT